MADFYTGPMRSSAPSGAPSKYTDPKLIDAILQSSDPGAVADAGRSYQKFAQAYEKIAGHLLSIRDDLHDAWSGEDAAAAQSQLREVWSAATTVHTAAGTFGSAIEAHGSEYLAWYKNNKPPSTSLAEAQSWMTGANERISQSWSSLPPDLSTTLPPGQDHISHGPASRGTPTGTAGSGGAGSGGAGLGGGHVPESIDHLPEDHSGADGSGTELAGLPTSGGDPGSPFGLPAGGGGVPSPLSSGGGYVAGPGGVPSAGGVLGFGPGSPGMPGAATGGGFRDVTGTAAGRPEAEAAAAESRAVTGSRGAMGPMIGGSGAQERERTRQTWLAEDKDVWTGDIESSPEVIGAIEPATAEEPPAEPPIEIDLAGAGDELATILAEIGGDADIEPDDEPKNVSEQITELRQKLAKLERQRDAERGLPSIAGDAGSDSDWLGGEDI